MVVCPVAEADWKPIRADPVVVAAWNERLHEVQQAPLAGWRAEAAEKASARLRDSMTLAVARSAEGTLWAWEGVLNTAAVCAAGRMDTDACRSRQLRTRRAIRSTGRPPSRSPRRRPMRRSRLWRS